MTSSPLAIWRLPPYSVQQVLTSLAETIDWGLEFADIPAQWKQTRGENVRVAILDTGVDTRHPDLQGAIEAAEDFSGSRFGPADRQGHGTHVAGTVAARQNNQGVVGVAPACQLLCGKVLGDDGSGSSQSVAEGLDWAVERGADIISMSLGSPQPSADIQAALSRALQAGRFVICAAGNEGRADSVNYPAKWPGPVIVGAIDRDGRLAPFSSRGPEMLARGICAPGADILSTYVGGGYARLSGTSMATPFVTGVVALMVAKHRQHAGDTPVTTQADLIEHLRRTAREAGPAGSDTDYGLGLIAPDALLNDTVDAPLESPTFELGPIAVNGVAGTLVFVPQVKATV